jgi:acyl-ACP thioesterase
LRLDAVARYLQDVASDDVEDAGVEYTDTAWVVRRTTIWVESPFLDDTAVTLATWCSGVASAAAARRTSLHGDRGGAIETETIWIHVDASGRPARHTDAFLRVYAPVAQGRRAPTRLELPPRPKVFWATSWRFRVTDEDRLGHVNNAAFWAPVEEQFYDALAEPLVAVVEYRKPIDVAEDVLVAHEDNMLWLVVESEVRASARLDPGRARDAE